MARRGGLHGADRRERNGGPQRQDPAAENGRRPGPHRHRHGPRLHLLLPREPRGADRRRRRADPLLAARGPAPAPGRRALHRRRVPRGLHGAARGQCDDARGRPQGDRRRRPGLGGVRRPDVPHAGDLLARPPRGDGRRARLLGGDGRPARGARVRPARGDGGRRLAARRTAAAGTRVPPLAARGSGRRGNLRLSDAARQRGGPGLRRSRPGRVRGRLHPPARRRRALLGDGLRRARPGKGSRRSGGAEGCEPFAALRGWARPRAPASRYARAMPGRAAAARRERSPPPSCPAR